jgi:excisionase family DNA binding protein
VDERHPLLRDSVSTQEAARLLGRTYQTVLGYIRDGKLPAFKVGGAYRITQLNITRFIAGAALRAEEDTHSQSRIRDPLGPEDHEMLDSIGLGKEETLV